MSLKQWVNLTKDEAFTKDGDGSTLERCGKITIEVMFKKDDVPISYKVKVTPVGSDNIEYTKKEKKRNSKFKLTKGTRGLSDKKDVLLEESIQLPAAGGNTYKVEAKDSNGKVASTTMDIEAKRKLYYQTISMDDKKGNSVPAQSLSDMENHSKGYHIDLFKKGSNQIIPYIKTLMMQSTGSNLGDFGSKVSKAFKLKNPLKKYGVAVVFSEYISSKADHQFKQAVTIGTANPRCAWNTTDLMLAGDRFLWHGLDDTEDSAKHWFKDGVVLYTDVLTGTSKSYNIKRSDIDLLGNKQFTYGGYSQVKIKLNPALKSMVGSTQGYLEVVVNVRIADGWTNGFSWRYSGVDLITCARRVTWEDMPANTTKYTWNHEVGHRFGMTAWGHSTHGSKTLRDKLPDGPSTLYGENRGVNDKTHAGPHCEKGATFNSSAKTWSGTPACVMFGANGIGSTHSPDDYCSECKPIVRKLDLSP